MIYRNLMTAAAVFLLVLGIFFALWGPMTLPYLGNGSLPTPAQQYLTAWSAISFTRLFGAMLLTVGLIAWAVRKLDHPEDQRSIGLAFFIGSLFLLFIALTQKFTMWAPNSGWIAIFIIAMLPLSFGYMLFVEFGLTDFRPLTLSQDPEKLRQRWIRQLSEAAAQQERNRLARDLHDSIKQQIFSINVSAAAAQERWASDSAGARQALTDVRNSAREAMTEMEAMLQQLRPAPLENIGLVEALRKQAEAVQYRTGAYVTAEFSDLPDNDTLLPGTQEAIFRIAQEALSNIARHARAKNVQLRLYQQRDGENPVLWLKIEDDGSGFDTTQPGTGMGLANINVRAAEIGGRLHIESASGEGTNLVVSILIISPDVVKIRRMCYAHRAYAFAVVFIFAILFRYGNQTGDLLSRDSITILILILLLPAYFNVRKEKRLLEKLRSTKYVPLTVSLGLARDNYQTRFFVNTFLVTCGMPWTIPQRIFTQARLYYAIFLFTAFLGAVLWSTMPRIHRIMKELKEKISPIEFQQSTEQMWSQAIITLMIVIPLVIVLSWWTHELQPLLLFTPLSALYLGYVAWWRHRNHSKTAQGA
jgi:signal transduction histidine kinase